MNKQPPSIETLLRKIPAVVKAARSRKPTDSYLFRSQYLREQADSLSADIEGPCELLEQLRDVLKRSLTPAERSMQWRDISGE